MNTTSLRTVFLDAGGVLVRPDWKRIAAVLGSRGIEVPAVALARADAPAKRDIDLPATVRATDDRKRAPLFYERVLHHAGVAAPAATRDRALAALEEEGRRTNLWSDVPPSVPGALGRLRAAGLALVVVSNADGRIESLFREIGLAGRFDHVVDSGVLGVEKPDPRIFREALRVSGADAASTVHVGDLYEIDVVGARAAGLRAVLLDPDGLYADRDVERHPDLAAFTDSLLGA